MLLTHTIRTFGVAIFLLGVAGLHGSAAELAPIQVSLVIQESCAIQSGADSVFAGILGVSCLHDTPYSVTLAPHDPTTPSSTLSVADLTAQRAVWMVAF
jgi:hypothetical protein